MHFIFLWTKLKRLSIAKGWCSMDLIQQHDICWYSSLPPYFWQIFSKWDVNFPTEIILLSTRWYRLRPSRPEGPLLHGPVRAGAPEASTDQPPAVCRPVLQGRQPHPEERLCQAAAGPRRRHPGAGPARPIRHGPGEAGHREGPSKKASANGERFVFIFSN